MWLGTYAYWYSKRSSNENKMGIVNNINVLGIRAGVGAGNFAVFWHFSRFFGSFIQKQWCFLGKTQTASSVKAFPCAYA